MLCAVSFVLSYSGLVAVAAWAAVPPYLSWTVPVTIDASILVYTLAVFIFRARGERNGRVWTSLILFTAVSVTANAAHAWDAGAGDWHGYAGAAIAGLAPVSVLLTTHTLAELVVAKPASHPIAASLPTQATPVSSPPPATSNRTASQRPQTDSSNPADAVKGPALRAAVQRRDGPVQMKSSAERASRVPGETLHLVDMHSPATEGGGPLSDEEAVAVIRQLDHQSGPVSRRTVERAVGCAASRATRLMARARPAVDHDHQAAKPAG